MNTQTKLTVLSYGAGQDSTAILYKIIYDPATYRYIEHVQKLCKEHKIDYMSHGHCLMSKY